MRRAALVALALALAAAAGCGSSDDTAKSTPTAVKTATATATATATPQLESPDVARMPPTAPPDATQRPIAAGAVDQDALRAAFDDAQRMWEREFSAAGIAYPPARLTFFSTHVDTVCGEASTGSGPFYCPASRGVYFDVPFFGTLARRFGGAGADAQAYVLAHEVAHHVQGAVGLLGRVHAADQSDPGGANARSVRVELQADCYAGVWMRTQYARGDLTPEGIAEALHAAAVVGDDFQHELAGRVPRPENFTHGTSEQRQTWLRRGLDDGRPAACDTFG